MSEYITVHEAQQILESRVAPIERPERVALAEALGRMLAEPVGAPIDVPPFSRSAMDGYAFRSQNTPGTLRVVGTLYAGETWPRALASGEALRIMTGAPLPSGADTVLEQERVTDGPAIAVLDRIRPGRNIMERGHEFRQGQPVLDAGTALGPFEIGQLAALGITDVLVQGRLRVAILVTGDEVQPGGSPLKPGAIFDANGPLLSALLASWDCQTRLSYVADHPKRLIRAIERAAAGSDVILTTGGVSVGAHDYLPHLMETHAERLFWRVDMHPGKATGAALMADGTPLLALSGNPGAMLTAWHLLGAPLIARLAGQPYQMRAVTGRLTHPFSKSTRETRYLKARFVSSAAGTEFVVLDNQSSDALRSFREADGLVVIPHGSPPLPAGHSVIGLRWPRR